MASLAGMTGVPTRTGYAASKQRLFGFFDSLRLELLGSGVDVTLIASDSWSRRSTAGPRARTVVASAEAPCKNPRS